MQVIDSAYQTCFYGAWCYAQKCLSCYRSNNGNDDIVRYRRQNYRQSAPHGNDNNSIVAHRNYDDESLMVLCFNSELLIPVDEQSIYKLGIVML